MGILNKIIDAATERLTNIETVRMSYTEMAKLITEKFIDGADDEFLEKVRKTAKGGFVTRKKIKSTNERYEFQVGELQRGVLITGSRKTVEIFDNEENKLYKIEKDRHWKKFYKAVDSAIKTEKALRGK